VSIKKEPQTINEQSPSDLLHKLKGAEQRLADSQHLHNALIESIGDGLIIVNEYGVINEINKAALDMLGYDREEMIGEWLPRALPSKDKDGNDLPPTERPSLKSLITGHPETAITTYTRKDGSNFPVSGTAAPLMVEGKPKGSIIVFRDFSREVLVERAKNEFVSLASHQLRTPITSILLYIGLIKYDEKGLSAEIKDYLKRIEMSAQSMQQLVGDFLNISSLELGGVEARPIPIDLIELINDQISEIIGLAADAGVKISFSEPKEPATVSTDPALLGQAIHNIMTNAIRYKATSAAEIKIKIKKQPQNYVITVADNGIGIPEDSQHKIFQRLYRADNAVKQHTQGTGLGLYLVKKIVETLGGKIWFESQENVGTTFFIQLPKNRFKLPVIESMQR